MEAMGLDDTCVLASPFLFLCFFGVFDVSSPGECDAFMTLALIVACCVFG